MALGIKPTVDFAFKKIFGSPENVPALIGLLNAILKLPSPITDVEILNPFNYEEFVGDKKIILDIRAQDSTGHLLNIEMQVDVAVGLAQRLVYYACSLYADQLESGDKYKTLKPAISICLLKGTFFKDTEVAHHQFRLYDQEHGRDLGDMLELHTIELPKYNLDEATISKASKIDQWVFFLLKADKYDPDELRSLLPGVEFGQAITVIERISQKTEDRMMYDQREKAQRDQQWLLEGAREEGKVIGKIVLLQDILGDPVMAEAELDKLDESDLNRMCAELQQRLRSRGIS
jgi:predicted transposase/invertase (TIGR01784 family)